MNISSTMTFSKIPSFFLSLAKGLFTWAPKVLSKRSKNGKVVIRKLSTLYANAKSFYGFYTKNW